MNCVRNLTLVLVISCGMAPSVALACACCSSPDTYTSELRSVEDFLAVKMSGDLGVYIYGEAGEPSIPIGKSKVKGAANLKTKEVEFTVYRDVKPIGMLILRPKGLAEYSKVSADLMIGNEGATKLNSTQDDPAIYHQVKIKVILEADKTLLKELGVSIEKDALFVLHGYSNACWYPHAGYPGRWSLNYNVRKGSESINAFGRGILEK